MKDNIIESIKTQTPHLIWVNKNFYKDGEIINVNINTATGDCYDSKKGLPEDSYVSYDNAVYGCVYDDYLYVTEYNEELDGIVMHAYWIDKKCFDCNFPNVSLNCDANALFRIDNFTSIKRKGLYLINRDKSVININTKTHKKAPDLLKKFKNIYFLRRVFNHNQAMLQLIPVGYFGNGKHGLLNTAENIADYFSAKIPDYNTAHTQTLNEYLSIPLDDIPDFEEAKFCFVSKLEETVVLRWVIQINNQKYEIKRLYVNKDSSVGGVVVGDICAADSDNYTPTFCYLADTKLLKDAKEYTLHLDSSIIENSKLSYFEEVLATFDEEYRLLALMNMILHPSFEKMAKSDNNWLCQKYLMEKSTSWNYYLTKCFGKIDKNASSINTLLGINKYQLSIAKEQYDNKANLIKTIKEAVNVDVLCSIDNNSFDIMYKYILSCGKSFKNGIYRMSLLYPLTSVINILPVLETIALQGKNSSIETYFTDIIRMIGNMNAINNIPINRKTIRSAEDIVSMHNILVDAYNVYKVQHEYSSYESRFEKRKQVWEKWESDDDEEYIVVAPKHPIDIAAEGIKLHHCVKSYIPAVASGETNIMFIRKKENPDIPFFTVEIRGNTIRQIHGSDNRNVSTEPGLDKFIENWKKKVNVRGSKYNGVY